MFVSFLNAVDKFSLLLFGGIFYKGVVCVVIVALMMVTVEAVGDIKQSLLKTQ